MVMSQRQITSNCIAQKQGKKQKNFPSISFVWTFYRGNNEVNLIESEEANEENRYSSHDTGGNRSGGYAGVFITRNPETTKVEQKHEKIKKEGKAYAGKYRMNISLDTKNKVLSGTVRASLKNATDDDLKSICVRNWAAAILQEKTNQKKKACKTEITSARIGGHTLQIDKKEDASVLYLSDKNRVLAPAASV